MKICPVGAELLHAGGRVGERMAGQTCVTNLTVAFSNFLTRLKKLALKNKIVAVINSSSSLSSSSSSSSSRNPSHERSISIQSKFSTHCDPFLPFSISSIFSFRLNHPVAACVFFLNCAPLLTFLP